MCVRHRRCLCERSGARHRCFITAFGYSLMAMAFTMLVPVALSASSWLSHLCIPRRPSHRPVVVFPVPIAQGHRPYRRHAIAGAGYTEVGGAWRGDGLLPAGGGGAFPRCRVTAHENAQAFLSVEFSGRNGWRKNLRGRREFCSKQFTPSSLTLIFLEQLQESRDYGDTHRRIAF